jgi:protoporphyrinogen oxidase
VGAGFSGLSAAMELADAGIDVTVLESDQTVGGLAATFSVGGFELERFYHHWFTNDRHVMDLVDRLGVTDKVLRRDTKTGMYYANRLFRLSRPLDLLRFSPLGFLDRIRLGLLVIQVRAIKDWRTLEKLSAEEWLISLCGRSVYAVVWEPLLKGKFGAVASDVSAVWFWNKLVLRGGSRDKSGKEQLAYFRGGFGALALAMRNYIESRGGRILTQTPAVGLTMECGRLREIKTPSGSIAADAVILTPALPQIIELLKPHVEREQVERLGAIRFLANICLVLNMKHSLSETYWLNVNDPSFPFVGLIEHTNFEPPGSYGGRHIAYLSKYLPESDPLYRMDDRGFFEFALPYIQRIIPKFDRSWVTDYYVWRANYAQPIVEKNYSKLLPSRKIMREVYICTMAQIYPEDRGTNYAIRDGVATAQLLMTELGYLRPQDRVNAL